MIEEYIQISELVEYEGLSTEELTAIRMRLADLITKAPDYLDTYLLLREVYTMAEMHTQADKVLERAYKRALGLILDEQGRWPDVMEWVFMDNRPIIRTLNEKARALWYEGIDDPESWRKAFAIYENLLRTNPNDNIGTRYLLLAMLEKMTPPEFDDRFIVWNELAGEVYNGKENKWFDSKSKKHPELKLWLAHAKAQGWT